MKNRKKFFIISSIVIALLFLGAIAVYAKYQQIQSALIEQNIGLDAVTPPSTLVQIPNPVQDVSPVTSEEPAAMSDSISSNIRAIPADPLKVKTYCGGPPVMYILGIGADSGVDYLYGLADIIRIARIDFVTPKVSVLSLSRDLWVEIPDLNHKYDINHGKINQAYFYGGPGMGYYSGPDGGPGLLSRTIKYNFGIQTDFYGAINMQTFVDVVNALGGIDVVLPQAVDGRADDRGYFYAGTNHLNGEQALNLVRIRYPYSDFVRQDNQTRVINAILTKFKDFHVFLKLPKIISAFQDSVLTDLNLTQVGQLICLYTVLDSQNIVFTQLPAETMTASTIYSPQQKDNTFILKPDFEAIRQYIDQFEAGSWP